MFTQSVQETEGEVSDDRIPFKLAFENPVIQRIFSEMFMQLAALEYRNRGLLEGKVQYNGKKCPV